MANSHLPEYVRTKLPNNAGEWLEYLRPKFTSLPVGCTDPKCPFDKAMRQFEAFNKLLVAQIESGDEEAREFVDSNGYWLHICVPDIQNLDVFQPWLRNCILLHPQRRRASQLLFRAVVDDEFPEDVQTPVAKLRYACKTVIAEKSDEQYELGNLLKDPDDLWLFRDGNGLEPLDDLPTDDPEFPTNCSVCIEPYAPVDQWPTHGPSTPVKTPCGHYFCSKCLKAWLEECIDEYTCPVCRACLVCGDNGCRFHVIRRDNAPPTPLPHVLNVVLGPSKGLQPLHGIQVSVYWNLRERTRHLRADLAGIESELSRANVDFEDPVYKQLVVYFRDIWSTLRRDVKKELKHQSR